MMPIKLRGLKVSGKSRQTGEKPNVVRRRFGNIVMLVLLLALLTGCGTPQEKTGQASKAGNGSTQPGQTQPANTQSSLTQPETSAETATSGTSGHGSTSLPPDSLISASQLDQGIKAKKPWQIIDVREPSEFASGHIPGAVNIPLGKLATSLNQIPKDKDVILVDLNATRSYTAWQQLKDKGYDPQHLKLLVGGMEQWKSLGSGEVTESIGGC